jgi:hypothetical protein
MKQLLFLLFSAMITSANAQSFSNTAFENARVSFSTGYVHEFSGLNGWGATATYQLPLNNFLESGIGIRRVQTAGHPRTATIAEFTRATALDLHLVFIPIHTDNTMLSFGLMYSFSVFHVQRAYPLYDAHAGLNNNLDPVWQSQAIKGKTRGMGLMAAYEYTFEGRYAAGLRITYSQAYTDVLMAAPFVAIRL